MKMKKYLKNIAFLLSCAFVLQSCGGDGDEGIMIYGGVKHDGYLSISDYGRYGTTGIVLQDKAYIAGGYAYNDANEKYLLDKVGIIDFQSGKVSKELTMGTARANMVSVADYTQAYFAGGEMMDALRVTESDEVSILTAMGEWRPSSMKLSVPRARFAGEKAGSVLIFAGGYSNGTYLSSVDIYNLNKNYEHTSDRLLKPRADLASAAINNYIFFAGGINEDGPQDDVEIYDVRKNYWITDNNAVSRLSEARYGLVAEANNGLVLFAGGKNKYGYSRRVDIYNLNTREWTTDNLSESRSGIAVTQTGNFVLFAGGETAPGTYSDVVDIYDTVKGQFVTSLHLREPRAQATALAIENRVYVIGGIGEDGPSQIIDIFELN